MNACRHRNWRLLLAAMLAGVVTAQARAATAEDLADYEFKAPSGRTVYRLGDILVDKSALATRETSPGAKLALKGTVWPFAVTYYEFNANVLNFNRSLFRAAIDEWTRGTGIAFVESSTASNRILVSDDPGNIGGGSSQLGMVGGVQDLLIKDWVATVIIHEMGHALGTPHEQTRLDRNDRVVIVDLDDMGGHCPNLLTTNWGIGSAINQSAYDFASIMHYPHEVSFLCDGMFRRVRIDSLGGQPPGPPAGSESVCTTPSQCNAIMGASTLSARDTYGMGQIYPAREACQWESVGTPGNGMNGPVNALAVFDDGSGPALYAAGGFSAVGGISANSIAKWNGTAWSALGGPTNGLNSTVNALAVYNDGSGPALFVGGSFSMAGGVSANSLAKWTGSQWLPVGGTPNGLNGPVYALAVHNDGSGSSLFVGGGFSTASGTSASSIAKWNGSSWTALGSPTNGMNGPVFTLVTHNDGSGLALYAGGGFSTAGGVSAASIARWDGALWRAVGSTGSGMNGPVNALAAEPGGLLYAGGGFGTAGSGAAASIARWNGTSWSVLGNPSNGVNAAVNALALHDDGSGYGARLFVGGGFSTAGGNPALSIAQWDGAAWTEVGRGMDGPVKALVVHDDRTGDGRALYVGGGFNRAWGAAANSIARYSCFLLKSGFEQ